MCADNPNTRGEGGGKLGKEMFSFNKFLLTTMMQYFLIRVSSFSAVHSLTFYLSTKGSEIFGLSDLVKRLFVC